MDLHPRLQPSFVFIFALALLSKGQNSDLFVVHPSSVVAAMRRSVEFNCSCRGHALVWYVDNELVSRQHDAERGINYQTTTRDGVFVSQLLVMATERNNNSKVECGVFVYGEGIRRGRTAAFLTIQGYLAAPEHFEVIAQQRILQLKWTPPFSLAEISILGYLLNATEVTNIHASSLESKLLNSTVTSYNFTTENPSPCYEYQFLIRAINEVGYGKWSYQVNGSFQDVPSPVAGENVEVVIRLGGHVGVTFMFLGDDCPGRYVDDYIVHILTVQPHIYQCTHSLTTASSVEEVALTFTATTDILPLNEHYYCIIEAQNEMGSRNGSGIYISTFDVQNVSELTEEPPGNFCTQCIYVEGSKAKGCCIRLEEIGKETKAYRDETFPTCIQVANGGNYTLLVYDIEENETEVTSYSCYQNAKPAVTRDVIIRGNDMDREGEPLDRERESLDNEGEAWDTEGEPLDKEGKPLAKVTMITTTVAGGVLMLLVLAVFITICTIIYQIKRKKKKGLKQHIKDPISQLKDCPDLQIQTTPNQAYGELPITPQSSQDQDVHTYEDVHIYEEIPTFNT